ncbi:MAG: hypothetical protein U0871_26505 [Gemmataceae bacterium]
MLRVSDPAPVPPMVPLPSNATGAVNAIGLAAFWVSVFDAPPRTRRRRR